MLHGVGHGASVVSKIRQGQFVARNVVCQCQPLFRAHLHLLNQLFCQLDVLVVHTQQVAVFQKTEIAVEHLHFNVIRNNLQVGRCHLCLISRLLYSCRYLTSGVERLIERKRKQVAQMGHCRTCRVRKVTFQNCCIPQIVYSCFQTDVGQSLCPCVLF